MAKNKHKKLSIANFIVVAFLTVIGIFLSVCSFNIPGTTNTYNGFANSISLGLDLAGGISVVYDCSVDEGANLDSAVAATKTRLESLITKKYSEATVTRQGSSRIRIEVPSASDAEEVFKLIGTPTPLYMTLEEKSDAKVWVEGTDISDVQVSYQDEKFGVSVTFNAEGKKKFADLTDKAANGSSSEGAGYGAKKIYVYLGDMTDSETTVLPLTCEQKITGGSTFISGNFKTREDAENYALQLMSGTFNAKLSLVESTVISATLGTEALRLAIIGGLIGFVVILLIMIFRYGDFGVLASLSLVIYMILMLFFLQAISFVQLTLPGLAGIILSIGMAVDGTVIIFEKFREEYKNGKKIPSAVKGGFKSAFWPIFDSNITTIITGIVLYILGTASIQGFAITLLIGIILSMFMNLVLLRVFAKWYVNINSTKAKRLRLPKQARTYKEPNEVVVGGQTNE